MTEYYKNKIKKYETKYKLLNGGHFLNYYNKDITFYNDNILNYDYSIQNIENIQSLGSGHFGQTYRIKFKNLISPTVMKINIKSDESLYSEFVCGLCVNNIKKFLPNFIFTLNLYKFQEEIDSNTVIELLNVQTGALLLENANLLNEKHDILFNEQTIAKYKYKTCILLEEIEGDTVYSMERLIKKENIYNQYAILFQIYAALFAIRKKFSHKDLHLGNVLLYKSDVPIKIMYSNDIIIYAKYVPIIIDYGKSYFFVSEEFNTSTLRTEHIKQFKNESIDLRFFHLYCDMFKYDPKIEENFKIIKLYLDEDINFDDINEQQNKNIKYRHRPYIYPITLEHYKKSNGILNKNNFYYKFSEIVTDIVYAPNDFTGENLDVAEGHILNVEQLFHKLVFFHNAMNYNDYKPDEYNKIMKIDLNMENEIVFL